jgi:thiaminase (transcriptional activator TenA)
MTSPAGRTGWSAELWSTSTSVYAAILVHPFLAGLTSGELPVGTFTYYVAQDAHYLRDFARALAVVGAKAPTHETTGMFARHAAGTVVVEQALHDSLLAALGLDPAVVSSTPISPTTTAYTSYLLATCYGGSFAEGLAAVLPCYWIYAEVGRALLVRGSPDPRYQQWIETYGGEEFTASVVEVLDLTDLVGDGISPAERRRAEAHYRVASRYEWMFWDAAWRRESWPM